MPFLPVENKEYWGQDYCKSPEHNPPSMIVLSPGEHKWQCPSCGHITTFYVQGVE